MRKQIHFQMCQVFKQEWETKHGGRYFVTGRDLKEAHEFFVNNGELTAEEMRPHMATYFDSDFPAWVDQNYPAWGLFRNFNNFTPKQTVRKSTRYCPDCHTTHSMNTPCPTQRDVLSLVSQVKKVL
jgi:hypothetical protein